jgi:hypothetical protein
MGKRHRLYGDIPLTYLSTSLVNRVYKSSNYSVKDGLCKTTAHTMECLRFTAFGKAVYIGLFENVSNSQDLLDRIQRVAKLETPERDRERELVNYAFIDAGLV